MRFPKALLVTFAVLGSSGLVAIAQDKIGIPACDDFFTKYDACMAKIPAAQQATYKGQMDQMRTAWKGMAANPQTKATLESTCTQMNATMKTSMAQFGCQW